MTGLVVRNRGIFRRAETTISEGRIFRRMFCRAVVPLHDVACGAATRSIIARLIVRAGQRKQRIEQARLLQAEKYGIGAKLRAKSAIAEFVVGLAGIVGAHWLAHFTLGAAAA